MIHVKNVNKYFNKNKKSEIHVLNEINVSFPDKGLVVLKGNSGSGKTTFLNILGGLDSVNTGEITLDGIKIKHYSPKVWNKIRTEKIGYIFQNYYLIPSLSVFDNVAISLKMIGMVDEEDIKERVNYILKQVGIYKFRKRHANQLSGGQQQRVAIARALVKNPKIIIADEPTGNLDSANTIDVMNIIKKISEERLVVLVTHEKEIANFYGDRIIEIDDGRVISDFENETKDSYKVEEADTYYLKDFKHQETKGNIRFYSDQDDIKFDEDIMMNLIYKNGRLVLDINGVIKKVQLATTDSGINIYDKHFEQMDKETFMETTYQVDEIDVNPNVKKRETLYTFKSNVKNAIFKLLRMTKSEKIMLLGFLVSGIITAFAASVLGNELFYDYVRTFELENYVEFNKQALNMPLEDITSLNDDDPNFFINVYRTNEIKISIPSMFRYDKTYELKGELDLIEHITEDDLIYGRMPENIYEIVVDKRVFDMTTGTYKKLLEFGVWDSSQLIGEKVIIRDTEIEIVGISDTTSQRIFGDRTILTLLAYTNLDVISSFLSLDLLYDQVEIVDGRLPERGSKEVLVPSSWVGKFIPAWAFDVDEYDYRGHMISGSYNEELIEYDYLQYIAYNEDIEFYVFRNSVGNMSVYSSDPESLLRAMEEIDLVANWPYGDTIIRAESEQNKMLPILYISVFILLFTGIGMYYMMRSSMLSRIYEISVYRALGVKQKSIMRGFVIELILITSVSSLVGYVISCLVILNIQRYSYLKNIAYLNTPAIIFGFVLIYVINLIFGTMSIRGQLRKTPSELLSSYDM